MSDDLTITYPLLEQIRSRFKGCKFIIVFIDPKKYGSIMESVRNYLIKNNNDSFLIAGYIGDMGSGDNSEMRSHSFSYEQYNQLYATYPELNELDHPIRMAVVDKDSVAHIGCEADAKEIIYRMICCFRNKIDEDRCYIVKKNSHNVFEYILNPLVMVRIIVYPVVIFFLFVLVLSSEGPINYALFAGISAIVISVMVFISSAYSDEKKKDLNSHCAGIILSWLLPGSGTMTYSKIKGIIFLGIYLAYAAIGWAFLGTIDGKVSVSVYNKAFIMYMLTPMFFAYAALTDIICNYARRFRFITNTLFVELIIILCPIPWIAFLSMFSGIISLGTYALIPMIMYVLPIAYQMALLLKYRFKVITVKMPESLLNFENPEGSSKRHKKKVSE